MTGIITDYIPQREPIVMIDNLVSASEEGATTQYHIKENNIFITDGHFNESGLIENIAQTAAAQAGYICRQKNVAPPVGFIASINALEVYALPVINSSVETTVTITNRVFDVVIIEGDVKQHEEILCRCKMKIFTQS
ncbi:MAG: 3-hydroxyacyl-ACP dehydratase [Cyclobacteriaceae bacterium]|nr:3-hydroxyacyl-ACP dehydratase [Cyclobacteriaceae bacterium]